MALKSQLLGGASSVATFMGLGRRAAVPAAAAKPKKTAAPADQDADEGSEDEAAATAKPAGEREESADDDAAAAGSGAGAGQAAAKGDDDDDEEKDDEGDDDDDEMKGTGKKASARRRERARCRAILTSEAAQANPQQALHLALNTSLTRQDAIALLGTMPASNGLNARMAGVPNPNLGAGRRAAATAADPHAVEKAWDRSMAKAINPTRPGQGSAAAGWDRALTATR